MRERGWVSSHFISFHFISLHVAHFHSCLQLISFSFHFHFVSSSQSFSHLFFFFHYFIHSFHFISFMRFPLSFRSFSFHLRRALPFIVFFTAASVTSSPAMCCCNSPKIRNLRPGACRALPGMTASDSLPFNFPIFQDLNQHSKTLTILS